MVRRSRAGVFRVHRPWDRTCILNRRDCEPLTLSYGRHYNRFGRFCQLRVTLGAMHFQEKAALHLQDGGSHLSTVAPYGILADVCVGLHILLPETFWVSSMCCSHGLGLVGQDPTTHLCTSSCPQAGARGTRSPFSCSLATRRQGHLEWDAVRTGRTAGSHCAVAGRKGSMTQVIVNGCLRSYNGVMRKAVRSRSLPSLFLQR